jgi:hypothetical protein
VVVAIHGFGSVWERRFGKAELRRTPTALLAPPITTQPPFW